MKSAGLILLVSVLLLMPRHPASGERAITVGSPPSIGPAAPGAGAIIVGRSPSVGTATQHPAVCRISNTMPGGCINWGSGTVVDVDKTSALVLTCWHIFEDGTGQVGVCVGGRCVVGRLVTVDQAWDLAAVEISGTGLRAVPIAGESPSRGERLIACGFGKGQYACVAGRLRGYVATETAASRETMEIGAGVREGDSGGPVLNGRGELVGVAWGSDGRITEATCVGPIRRFLGRLRGRDGRQVIGPPAARPDAPAARRPLVPIPPGAQPIAPSIPVPPRQPRTPDLIDREKLAAAIEAAFAALEARLEARRKAAPIDAGQAQRPILDAIGELGRKIGPGIDRQAIRDDFRAVAGDLVDAAAPTVVETALPAALSALGWTGPPAIAAWLIARLGLGLLRRRRQRRELAQATGAGQPTSPSPSIQIYTPTPETGDYLAYWAHHFEATGGNLREEAAKAPIYVEALEALKAGKIQVDVKPAMIAGGIDGLVAREFARRGEILPQGDFRDAAYLGFLYRDAVARLRGGLLTACGFRESADAIGAWVAQEFQLKVKRPPHVTFLQGVLS